MVRKQKKNISETSRKTRVKMHKSGKHWVRTILSKIGWVKISSEPEDIKVNSSKMPESYMRTSTLIKGAVSAGAILGGGLAVDSVFAEDTVIASEANASTIANTETVSMSKPETSTSVVASESDTSVQSQSLSIEASQSSSLSTSDSLSISSSESLSSSTSESLSESQSESMSDSASLSQSKTLTKASSSSQESQSSDDSSKTTDLTTESRTSETTTSNELSSQSTVDSTVTAESNTENAFTATEAANTTLNNDSEAMAIVLADGDQVEASEISSTVAVTSETALAATATSVSSESQSEEVANSAFDAGEEPTALGPVAMMRAAEAPVMMEEAAVFYSTPDNTATSVITNGSSTPSAISDSGTVDDVPYADVPNNFKHSIMSIDYTFDKDTGIIVYTVVAEPALESEGHWGMAFGVDSTSTIQSITVRSPETPLYNSETRVNQNLGPYVGYDSNLSNAGYAIVRSNSTTKPLSLIFTVTVQTSSTDGSYGIDHLYARYASSSSTGGIIGRGEVYNQLMRGYTNYGANRLDYTEGMTFDNTVPGAPQITSTVDTASRTLSGTSQPGTLVRATFADGSMATATTTTSGTWTIAVPSVTNLSAGSVITVDATETSSGSGSNVYYGDNHTSVPSTVTVGNEAPKITVADVQPLEKGEYYQIDFPVTITDAEDDRYTTDDKSMSIVFDVTDPDGEEVTRFNEATGEFQTTKEGDYLVTVTAVDSDGAWSQVTYSITVRDTTPPSPPYILDYSDGSVVIEAPIDGNPDDDDLTDSDVAKMTVEYQDEDGVSHVLTATKDETGLWTISRME